MLDNFNLLSLMQRHKIVEEVLDREVRSALFLDGGNIEVADMKLDGEITEVYVKFKGACRDCPAAEFGTLNFIQSTLRENIADAIIVKSI
jgi:NifU-like protein